MFRPAGVLTTPVAPTATAYTVWQPWFLRPSLSWVVTSPRPGYACRPNRAIDGRGLSPHKMRSLVGCSPNAGAHLLPEAEARHERRLEAVRCSAWLGAGLGSDLGCPHCSSGLAFGGDDFEILAWNHHSLIARLIEAVYVLQHGTTEALLPLCRQPFEGAYRGTKVRPKVLQIMLG